MSYRHPKGFSATQSSTGYAGGTPTKPARISVGGYIESGLQAAIGRQVSIWMTPEVAARVAHTILGYVRQYAPEFAECQHEPEFHYGRERGKCRRCHLPLPNEE